MSDDETTTAERASTLETKYRGAAALDSRDSWTARKAAATDLRHALGMDKPAKSLNKEVCARAISYLEDGDLGRAGLLEAENTAKDLRESLADALELEDAPTSLGPVLYDLLARIEEEGDAENVGVLARKNKTDEEADFEESYLEIRLAAEKDNDEDE